MTVPEFKSYGFLGAGKVGKAILSALLAAQPNASFVILTRSSPDSKSTSHSPSPLSAASFPASQNIKYATVDYTSSSSIASALKEHEVEVLVDTAHVYKFDFHKIVVDGAKESGCVRLFVPSEFGFVTEGNESGGPLAEKARLHGYLREVGLPFVVIQNGVFIEFLPWMGLAQDGKYHIVGKGDKPISTSSITDVSGFVAHILTTRPLSSLANTYHRLQGSRLTMVEIAHALGLTPTFVDEVPNTESEGGESGFQTTLQRMFDTGRGSIGWDYSRGVDDESLAGSGNKGWEGHVWKTVEDVHGKA